MRLKRVIALLLLAGGVWQVQASCGDEDIEGVGESSIEELQNVAINAFAASRAKREAAKLEELKSPHVHDATQNNEHQGEDVHTHEHEHEHSKNERTSKTNI